jgi:polar amino acid transport system substrate-binding protein
MDTGRRSHKMRLRAALACAAAVLAGADLGAAELPTVKACGHHDYPPWNWKHEREIVGACATVARRAVERLGYRVDLGYVGPWKRCQELVAAGEVDVNICAFRNAERESYSVFAQPRMGQNRVSIFVGRQWRQKERRFDDWQDLSGLRTAVVLGVSMGQAFDEFLAAHTRVQRVATVRQVLLMLDANRIDFVPFGHEAGLMEIERNGLAGRIVPLDKAALVGDLYLSVSKKSPLAPRINDIGAYFSRPGYLQELEAQLDEQQRRYIDSRPLLGADRPIER